MQASGLELAQTEKSEGVAELTHRIQGTTLVLQDQQARLVEVIHPGIEGTVVEPALYGALDGGTAAR